tara:strand:- start:101 stop:469 length:369 start_codon:yes stop_codon:yes gene_type:complete
MKLETLHKELDKRAKFLPSRIEKKLNFVSRRLMLRARLNATIDPKKRTGRLYESIKTKRTGTEIELVAGSASVNYADYVEFGTARMYPRLFLTKAYNLVLKDMKKELQQMIRMTLDVKNGRQ